MAAKPEPTTYYFTPTPYVPNNRLPVLLYQDVLPHPRTEDTVRGFLESNAWIRGGTWGAVPRHHFHPNTHECYAIIRGSSQLLVGVGPLDPKSRGSLIHVEVGDVIVLPAGVAHCSKVASDDYKYIGAYPKDAPKWKNEYGRDDSRLELLIKESVSVQIPEWDPVNGYLGPVHKIWMLETVFQRDSSKYSNNGVV